MIDYSLQRRALLATLRNGGAMVRDDVCDADPYLLRAAKHHGEPSEQTCPICRKSELTNLRYTFGHELGQYSGRIKTGAEIEAMASEHGEFTVYVVEVCQRCGWNHLVESYVLGDGVPRRPPRRRRTVEDEY